MEEGEREGEQEEEEEFSRWRRDVRRTFCKNEILNVYRNEITNTRAMCCRVNIKSICCRAMQSGVLLPADLQ